MPTPKHSKRATLLSQVLEFIDRGDYDDSNEFLVFGKEAFERYLGWSDEEPDGISESFGEFATKRKRNDGERIISNRISLSAVPDDTSTTDIDDLLARLPEETKKLLPGLANALVSTGGSPSSAQADEALDSALAKNSIRVLDESFARLSTWDEVEIDRASVRNPEYFEEAHKCDLFGLSIACAVLCRAVLEDALIKAVDRDGLIKRKAAATKASHIDLMLKKARTQGIFNREYSGKKTDPDAFSAERVKTGLGIRDAGNCAIHDLAKFRQFHAGKMRDVIDSTRKILFDLFRHN